MRVIRNYVFYCVGIFLCFSNIMYGRVGEQVIHDMKKTLKEPCLELLASSELIDWDTFEQRLKILKDAVIVFENKVAEHKKLVTPKPTFPPPAPEVEAPVVAPTPLVPVQPTPPPAPSPTPVPPAPEVEVPVVAPTLPTPVPVQPTPPPTLAPTPVPPAPEVEAPVAVPAPPVPVPVQPTPPPAPAPVPVPPAPEVEVPVAVPTPPSAITPSPITPIHTPEVGSMGMPGLSTEEELEEVEVTEPVDITPQIGVPGIPAGI